ncbi:MULTISPECIES: excinuclease ABC subunit UvrC [unclassified Helicobacter]|uniref:excinuclease ABC subunit UvrC n=1 Tax=unclassified Helicobacter TaxID=2593540 RepID=UPI000CF178F6|nr:MULTISPECIES: excinuclease ABC subunit UvrC [unclassified Helicobacter]
MITPEILKNLPSTFGIYQYMDHQGRVLYVGKAKNIKKRVRSYFRISDDRVLIQEDLSMRIQIMLQQVAYIHTIVVSSEQDALLLENSLIKQLKPKYNILLRDDKTYPYICIDMSCDFPRFEMTRKVRHCKDLYYFGPYPSGCRDILDSLYALFPLVQKKSCLSAKKACLFFQIQKCKAPCENRISKEEYLEILQSALFLLQNKTKLLEALEKKMHDLAQKLLFEEANTYKQRIEKIRPLTNFSQVAYHQPYNFDILSIIKEASSSKYYATLVQLFMRDGKIVASNFKNIKSDYEIDINSVYTQFILNHYKEKIPIVPQAILIDSELENQKELEDFIFQRQEKKVLIQKPLRGFKYNLVQIASKNAQEIFRQQNHLSPLLLEVKNTFKLSQTPFRIEIFDTSHHGFSFKVGGMVVFENEKFVRSDYRHYNLQGDDEYSQMQEMLTRRIQNFENNPPPNLWLIDGGRGQINLAKKLLDSTGVEIDIIGIAKEKLDYKAHRAKGRARDKIYLLDSMIALDTSNKSLQFLQKLRDEAHRFAITFHKSQKTKGFIKKLQYTPSELKRLLDFYGSFENLNQASKEEISKVLKKS